MGQSVFLLEAQQSTRGFKSLRGFSSTSNHLLNRSLPGKIGKLQQNLNYSGLPTMDPHLSSSESFSASDPSKLTDSELDCLKEAFSMFDADHDGEITVHELGRVMRNHGLNPTDDELSDMIRNVDKRGNGGIDFNEFVEMMLLPRDPKVDDDDVVHAFRFFDRDGDGLISAEELKLTMNNLGEPLTDDEVR